MKKGRLLILTVIVLLLWGNLWILDYSRDREERKQEILANRLEKLTEESRKSVIIRRVSEQLEEVAYQQKDISDQRRQEAVKQKKEAELMRRLAEEETEKARKAQAGAIEAYHKAEEQKRIADQQREEALKARLKADTLAGLALGRSLGTMAVTQYRVGKRDLAALLGYYAWKYTSDYKGDCYQPAVLGALSEVSGSAAVYLQHEGNIRDICYMGKEQDTTSWVSVSEWGEVMLWQEYGGKWTGKELYQNSVYDFRRVAYDRQADIIYALDYSGILLVLKGKGYEQAESWNTGYGKVRGLILFAGQPYLFFKEGVVLRLGDTNPEEGVFYVHDSAILAVCRAVSGMWVADAGGNVGCLNDQGKWESRVRKEKEGKITALAADSSGRWLAIGYQSGEITLVDMAGGRQKILSGHISDVTDMVFCGGKLVSVGFDGKLNLWNVYLEKPESVGVATYSDWVYCIAVADGGGKVVCGGASRTLYVNSILPGQMAGKLKKSLKRDFTVEERKYYLGIRKEAGRDEQ